MTGQQIGLIAGILGSLIGLAGGAIGTFLCIKNTRTPAERAFMVQAAVAIWLAIIALLLMPMILEMRGLIAPWVHWIGLAVFFIGLGPAVAYTNRRGAELRGKPTETPGESIG